MLPVDCPLVTPSMLLELADACREGARFGRGPLPGAYRRSSLGALESGELAIHRVILNLDVVVIDADPALLANINTPDDLASLTRRGAIRI